MKNINKYFYTFVSFVLIYSGMFMADVGEKQPSYIVDYYHLIIFIVICVGVFFLGYMTRKTDEN